MDEKSLELAAQVAQLLIQRNETVAVAESSAGGLIAATLLSVPGASAYFLGGAVVYSRRARLLLMELPKEALEGMRSSSEPYARLLAQTSRQRFKASWGLAETGAAGPNGNAYGDPAGHSCLAVHGPVERYKTLRTGENDRVRNMEQFTREALALFLEAIRSAA